MGVKLIMKKILPNDGINILLKLLNKIRFFQIRFFCKKNGYYPGDNQTIERLIYRLDDVNQNGGNELLKYVSYLSSIDDNHEYYNLLMKNLFSNWDIELIEQMFIAKGSGFGPSSWNSFRKIKIENKMLLFEKIYMAAHEDVDRTLWFQYNIYDLLKKIITPKLMHLYTSKYAIATYFEYIELKEIIINRQIKLIEFSIELYNITCENEKYLLKLNIPKFLGKIEGHYIFNRYWLEAKDILNKNGINENIFINAIYNSRRVLTHADLGLRNSFDNMTLVDWDNFGFYPLGMDPAIIFHFNVENKNYIIDSESWLKQNYKEFIHYDDWDSFNFNFIAYLYVFSFRYKSSPQFESNQNFLIRKIRLYLTPKR